MDANIEVHCVPIYGELILSPIEYWIEDRSDGFYLASPFGSIGPYNQRDGVLRTARDIGLKVRQ